MGRRGRDSGPAHLPGWADAGHASSGHHDRHSHHERSCGHARCRRDPSSRPRKIEVADACPPARHCPGARQTNANRHRESDPCHRSRHGRGERAGQGAHRSWRKRSRRVVHGQRSGCQTSRRRRTDPAKIGCAHATRRPNRKCPSLAALHDARHARHLPSTARPGAFRYPLCVSIGYVNSARVYHTCACSASIWARGVTIRAWVVSLSTPTARQCYS